MIKARHVKPTFLFWLLALLALVWYLFGVLQCYIAWTMTEASVAPLVASGQMTQAYADYLLVMPDWVRWAFAAATGGGALGALLLLLRSSLATVLFVVSLFAAIAMYVQLYVLGGQAGVIPTSDFVIASVVTIVTIVMIVFSVMMKIRGVLR